MMDQNTPVDYEDSAHRYFVGGINYTSASQLVEKFRPPFDAVVESIKYAAKWGNSPEYWRAKWEKKNAVSKERGNLVHNKEEVIAYGRMGEKFHDKFIPVHNPAFVEEGIPWIKRPDGLYIENKVWHHGYKLAGRADRIILDTSADGVRRAHVEDWKSNETLHFKSYQNPRTGNFKVMRPPLGHIMDCNVWHYYLQLSEYMFMLEYQGFVPGTITMIHVPHPTELISFPKKVRYDVPYLKKEVLLMCKYLNQ